MASCRNGAKSNSSIYNNLKLTPPIWNRWSSLRGLSAISELLVIDIKAILQSYNKKLQGSVFYDNHDKVVLNLQASNMNASIILHQLTTTIFIDIKAIIAKL